VVHDGAAVSAVFNASGAGATAGVGGGATGVVGRTAAFGLTAIDMMSEPPPPTVRPNGSPLCVTRRARSPPYSSFNATDMREGSSREAEDTSTKPAFATSLPMKPSVALLASDTAADGGAGAEEHNRTRHCAVGNRADHTGRYHSTARRILCLVREARYISKQQPVVDVLLRPHCPTPLATVVLSHAPRSEIKHLCSGLSRRRAHGFTECASRC
jgi:hypothetical protein